VRLEHTELEACTPKERAIADKIIEACKHKPIKRLDAAYWKKNRPVYRNEAIHETADDRAERKNEILAGQIRDYLTTYGPATTSYLSSALHAGSASIRLACDSLGDQLTCKQATNGGNVTTLWACRLSARGAKV